ncbi:MAG: ABC transporter substrate-binding protein [Ilumatobacteraceae bacterium]|nr:ABC transporter substrate-binding protein [Ilumatobacteraceae bacterium]
MSVALIAASCGGDDDAADEPDTAEEATDTADDGEASEPAAEPSGGDDSESSDDGKSTTLIATLPQEPASWNYWEVGANALRVPTFYNVQETLVEVKPDGSIVPMLAEDWSISDDGLSYTFTIREAMFHDGSELDSADVVYSMLKNAESPLSKLSAPHLIVSSVEALDDTTVEIVLSQPSATFLKELGNSAGYVVPENFLEDNDAGSTMIGTGPFVFSDYKPDTSLTLTRFEDYWGDLPYFEVIDWRFVDDETAALNGLLAGEYDFVTAVLAEGIERVATFSDDAEYKVLFESAGEVSYLWLNVNEEAFQDIRVRQAIAHAVNREEAIAVYDGYADPTCLMVVPYAEPYNSDYCPYPYDPDTSMSLLAEAGYEDLEVDYPFAAVASHPFTMEVLTQQLGAVGIKVNSRSEDLTTWLDKTWAQGNYGMSEIRDSANILQYGCEGGREPLGKSSQLCIPEFEDQLALADSYTDNDEYLAAMSDLVKTLADLAWVTVIAAPRVPQVMTAGLDGIQEVRINNAVDVRSARWSD